MSHGPNGYKKADHPENSSLPNPPPHSPDGVPEQAGPTHEHQPAAAPGRVCWWPGRAPRQAAAAPGGPRKTFKRYTDTTPPQRPSPVSSTPLRLAPLTSKYPKLYVGNLDSKLTHRPQAREFFHRREGRHLISSKKTTKNKTSSYYVLFSSQSLLTHSTHSIHSARPRTHP